jgi:hypothetical protein
MGRLRQFNPNNYGSVAAINSEFESIIRYIVAAERGGRSYAELFQDLFDDDGELNLGVDFKFDGDGLQMKVGEDGTWDVLATAADLRGSPGRDVGDVPLPIITGVQTYTATAGQTVFNYVHSSTDTLFVVHEGLLLTPTTDYTNNATSDTVTLTSPASLSDKLIIYKVRGDAGITLARTDTVVAAASQSVFGVTFPAAGTYQAQVYLNGLLLAETLDYILSPGTSSITLLDPAVTNDVFTTVFMSVNSATVVPGLMLEGVYTDMTTGLIPVAKVAIGDEDIPQAKIDGLVEKLSTVAKITVGSSTPSGPVSGDFWLDTSQTPADLKVYDASAWYSVQPQTSLPTIKSTDAGYAVFINSTGSGYSYQPIDFSALILDAEKGVAGGVATLDGDGKLDPTQIPTVRTNDTFDYRISGALADGTKVMRRLFKEHIRITGLSVRLTSGTCSIQLGINGVSVGSVYSASGSTNDQEFGTVIDIDALAASKSLDVTISSNSSGTDMWLTVAFERLN